uniref:Peptidyl-prolyl cis-trans isomerase n=1 Tax=Panagrolaimus sp. ES5 TaxID=591445 RepID=A0AC34FVA5_9BILA
MDKSPYVLFETSMGKFILELYWNHAPKTCQNFAELARRGYYDDTIFHRVIREFMIQGGDPTGTGRGGTSIYGERFADEIDVIQRIGVVNTDASDQPTMPIKVIRAIPTEENTL